MPLDATASFTKLDSLGGRWDMLVRFKLALVGFKA
jgi:hypothetical protein